MKFSRYLVAGTVLSLILHGLGSACFSVYFENVSVAASKGGGVSVIGSLEDLVAGSVANAVSQSPPVEAVEPHMPTLEPVATALPARSPTMRSVQPVAAIASAAVVPAIEAMSAVQPLSAVEVVRSVEAARKPPPNVIEPVLPETVLQEVNMDALQAVTQTPKAKPAAQRAKARPQEAPQKTRRVQAQVKGAQASSNKGGERLTSRTASSSANGRADATTNDGGTRATSNYKGKVVAKLRRAKRYPKAARKQKLKGIVHVAFTISANGTVSGIRITRSSGQPLLDQATVEMVQRASPMPAFPKDLDLPRMTLQVPVQFDR